MTTYFFLGDYDGRTLQFGPVDTSLPPPGYNQSFPPTNPPQPAGPQGIITTQSPREEGERTDDSEDNKEK